MGRNKHAHSKKKRTTATENPPGRFLWIVSRLARFSDSRMGVSPGREIPCSLEWSYPLTRPLAGNRPGS